MKRPSQGETRQDRSQDACRRSYAQRVVRARRSGVGSDHRSDPEDGRQHRRQDRRKTGIQRKANPDGTSGPAPKGIRGFVNRSLIAANTVLDGIDAGAQTLLYTSGQAASDVVGHKYGDDARTVAEAFGRTGKNVFIVYKDVRGIRRSALLKAARGRVMKAKLQDGREVTIKVDEKGNAVASSVSQSCASNTSTSSEKSSYVSRRRSKIPTRLPIDVRDYV